MATPPALLTLAEAARALRTSRRTLYNWHHRGLLPLVKLGRATRVRQAVLEKLIGRGEVDGVRKRLRRAAARPDAAGT
jgi:excisionase family DNA binding protein